MPAPSHLLTGKLMYVGKNVGGHHRIVIFAPKEAVQACGGHLYETVTVSLPKPPPAPPAGSTGAQVARGLATKEKLLAASEELGPAASVRAITRKAGTNEAAINYHFGSKQGLHQALEARLFPAPAA